MSTTSRVIRAEPAAVFEILADGWLYPIWVVGASRIRSVDDHWPQPGSRLHHSVGLWPLLLDDDTQVEQVEPDRLIVLKARAWPTGEARVRIVLEPVGVHTRVTIEEDAVNGPATLLPGPVRHPMLHARNIETLARLAHLVEGRAHGSAG